MYSFLLQLKTRAEDSEFTRAAAAPTSGTYKVGHIILNSAPAASGYIGWVCVRAGTPGVFKGWGLIAS